MSKLYLIFLKIKLQLGYPVSGIFMSNLFHNLVITTESHIFFNMKKLGKRVRSKRGMGKGKWAKV